MIRKMISKIISVVLADAMLMTSVFTATAAGLGDINSDSAINAVDASEILSEYARISTNQKAQFTEEQKKAADVDKNGSINAVDASQVLSFYAYKSTSSSEAVGFEEFLVNPPVTTTKVTTTAATTTTTTTTTTSKVAPEAAPLIGKWYPTEGDDDDKRQGIEFTEEGYISMIFDLSAQLCFRDDGLFYNDKVYPYDTIKWDGDVMTLTDDGKDLIIMTRTESMEGMNGKYTVVGGEIYTGFAFILALLGAPPETTTVTLDMNGEQTEMSLNNIMKYRVNGNKLEMMITYQGEEKSNDEPIEFSVEGDILTVISNGETSTMRRVK